MPDFDILIAGSGPAGCAAALSLSAFAPELRICLVGSAPPTTPRIGETVPPVIKPILAHLGLWNRFLQAGHLPAYRSLSAWGTSELIANEFLFGVHAVGWRLDRAHFDTMLREIARERLASHLTTKVVTVSRESDFWNIILANGTSTSSRFVIDATGRGAALARSYGLRSHTRDTLVGCSIHVADQAEISRELLVETFSDGWWYTAGIPESRRVIVCMTDSDQARRLGLRHAESYMQKLHETRYMRALRGEILEGPTFWAANTRWVDQELDVPMMCVGDAGFSFDPVSGEGIVRALRSGIFAAYAVTDFLRDGDFRGLARYRTMLKRDINKYCTTLRDFYSLEDRWPMRPFWSRRLTDPANAFGAKTQAR